MDGCCKSRALPEVGHGIDYSGDQGWPFPGLTESTRRQDAAEANARQVREWTPVATPAGLE